jgi:small-conductance mechanosensitive channel
MIVGAWKDNDMTGLAHAADYLRAAAVPRIGEGLHGLWPMVARVALCAGYIGLTLFVFASLQDRQETITVALIGLVFASLRASTLAGTCAQRRVAFLLENEIKSARRTMAQGIDAAPISDVELDRSLDGLAKPLRIEYAGLTVIGAICLYKLVIAIFYGMAYQQILGLS